MLTLRKNVYNKISKRFKIIQCKENRNREGKQYFQFSNLQMFRGKTDTCIKKKKKLKNRALSLIILSQNIIEKMSIQKIWLHWAPAEQDSMRDKILE